MPPSGTIRCRIAGCAFETPAGLRARKGGKPRDGWARLDRHIERAHPEIEVNITALRAQGACDDRAYVAAGDPPPPRPGAPLDHPSRRAP